MKRFLLALSLVLVFHSYSLADRSWTILTAGSVVNAPITGDGSIGSPLSCATCIVSGGPLGTPSSGIGTNITGIPIAGLAGLGAGVDTALGIAVTGSGGIALKTNAALVTPDLGTPSAGVLTNTTGLPISTGVSGLGSNVAALLATFNLANFNTALSDADVATIAGAETLTSKQLTSPKIGTSILDTGGNILFGFTATASAVNYLQYANAAAGSPPKWTATGSDTDIGEFHILKALGNFTIQPGTDEVDTLDIQTAAGGHAVQLGTNPGSAAFGMLTFGNVTASATNYALEGNGIDSTIINAPTTSSTLYFRLGQSINQMVITSGQVQLGVDAASPVPQLLKSQDGVGSNIAGADLTVAGGNSTGTGVGGTLSLATTPVGTTGSSQNTSTTRMQIKADGGVGIGTTTLNADSRLEVAGHLTIEGTAPALSACGTSPSIVGTDIAGKVTTGSGVITSCTLTFATAWANAPACVVNDETAVQLASGVSTTTTLVISSATAITSQVISYSCFGRG